MRCISPFRKYSVQVIEAQEQIVMDARGFAHLAVLQKPIVANFEAGGLLDHEMEAALMHFEFPGLPEGINPLSRVSVFDTEAYAETLPAAQRDELVVQMEQRLETLAENHPNDFIIVRQPKAEIPWPSYDGDSVEDVLKFQQRLRINPERIRIYESENQNRKEIVLAMLRIEDPAAAERLATEQAVPEPSADILPDPPEKAEPEQEQPEQEPVEVEA